MKKLDEDIMIEKFAKIFALKRRDNSYPGSYYVEIDILNNFINTEKLK